MIKGDKMLITRFIGAAFLVSVLPITVCAAAGNGPEVGKPAPSLIGRTLDDKVYRLKSDKAGPKVVNFFWVGCKPCRQEMPELAQFEKKYKVVKFISIHTQPANTPEESLKSVAKFVKSLPGAPSNIVLAAGGVQETFQYLGLPHTILLDSDNVVLMNFTGYTPDNMQRMDKALQQLAKQ